MAEDQSIFSGARPCRGAVAIFGVTALRQVMTDSEVFGMPVSKAKQFSFPPVLQRLNAGLFTMTGEHHRTRQRLLLQLLGKQSPRENCDAMVEGWTAFRKDLKSCRDIPLLSEMRRLVREVCGRVIFGDAGLDLANVIQCYFHERRTFSTVALGTASRHQLVRTGLKLDKMLRTRLTEYRENRHSLPGRDKCVFSRLSGLASSLEPSLSDEELIAHGNVLFMSSSEPVAVTLTWVLLILSQCRDLRRAIREEVKSAFAGKSIPVYFPEATLPLLNSVVLETLRLLPPNAIMVRLTTRATQILAHNLPDACEVIVSPYVAHRDSDIYPEPDRFDPLRWKELNPPAYSYFPFGIGSRYCLGKPLANFIIVSMLARVLNEYDVILDHDQSIDWKMDITLMPSNEPLVRLVPAASSADVIPAAQIKGPLTELMNVHSATLWAQSGND